MTYQNLIADRSTWKNTVKTVGGDTMNIVAIQESRRTLRKGKTKYIYHRENSNEIYYNQSQNGVFFSPMAMTITNMKKYHDVFVTPPLTDEEKKWFDRNDYEKIKR